MTIFIANVPVFFFFFVKALPFLQIQEELTFLELEKQSLRPPLSLNSSRSRATRRSLYGQKAPSFSVVRRRRRRRPLSLGVFIMRDIKRGEAAEEPRPLFSRLLLMPERRRGGGDAQKSILRFPVRLERAAQKSAGGVLGGWGWRRRSVSFGLATQLLLTA